MTKSSSRTVLLTAVAALSLALPVARHAPPDVNAAVATFDYTSNLAAGILAQGGTHRQHGPGFGQFQLRPSLLGRRRCPGNVRRFPPDRHLGGRRSQEIINWEECASRTNTAGNQGDVIVWGDLIIRSWNSPDARSTGGRRPHPHHGPSAVHHTGAFCGDWPMFRVLPTPTHPGEPPAVDRGQEGVHVIDISDPTDPEVVAFVDTPCGSHTETLVPDPANNRLLVYVATRRPTRHSGRRSPARSPSTAVGSTSSSAPGRPVWASYLRFLPTGHPDTPPEELHPCHDSAAILGDVMKVSCAGGGGPTVWSLGPADGGSLDNPMFMFHRDLGTQIGHTAAWTWDGEVLIFGHEPGGGSQARCRETSTVLDRTLFFLDGDTGATVGTILHPRPQTALENCTWHNLNVVPTDRRYLLVSGNYQSGISVVDFTNPTMARKSLSRTRRRW